MPRLKKGSKKARERAEKMRAGKEKKKEDKPGVDKPSVDKTGEVYCPSCKAKGENIVMTNRGIKTLVCPKCKTWIEK